MQIAALACRDGVVQSILLACDAKDAGAKSRSRPPARSERGLTVLSHSTMYRICSHDSHLVLSFNFSLRKDSVHARVTGRGESISCV